MGIREEFEKLTEIAQVLQLIDGFGGHTECFYYIPLCIYKKAKSMSDSIKSKGCLYDGYILK